MRKAMAASIVAVTASVTAVASFGAIPYSDGFSYPADNTKSLGTNPPWVEALVKTPPMIVQPGSLNYPGFPTRGNSVQLNNGAADTNVVPLDATAITNGTVYYSMLLRFDALIPASNTNQAFFAGMDGRSVTATGFDTGAALVSKNDPNDATKVDLGIAPPGNNNATKQWAGGFTTSDVLFVVASYTFNTSSNTDDTVNLYVFANGAPIPVSAPATPSATSTTAAPATDLTGLTRFYLRDNTGEPSNISVDELRVGTSWSNILPLAGDTNFDGRVDADGYALLDRGFARYAAGDIPANTAGWTDGDFTLDHVVDANDYMLIDQAYLAQGGTFAPDLLSQRETQFGPDYVSQLLASVPEPASLAACGLAFLPLTRRARRPL